MIRLISTLLDADVIATLMGLATPEANYLAGYLQSALGPRRGFAVIMYCLGGLEK